MLAKSSGIRRKNLHSEDREIYSHPLIPHRSSDNDLLTSVSFPKLDNELLTSISFPKLHDHKSQAYCFLPATHLSTSSSMTGA